MYLTKMCKFGAGIFGSIFSASIWVLMFSMVFLSCKTDNNKTTIKGRVYKVNESGNASDISLANVRLISNDSLTSYVSRQKEVSNRRSEVLTSKIDSLEKLLSDLKMSYRNKEVEDYNTKQLAQYKDKSAFEGDRVMVHPLRRDIDDATLNFDKPGDIKTIDQGEIGEVIKVDRERNQYLVNFENKKGWIDGESIVKYEDVRKYKVDLKKKNEIGDKMLDIEDEIEKLVSEFIRINSTNYFFDNLTKVIPSDTTGRNGKFELETEGSGKKYVLARSKLDGLNVHWLEPISIDRSKKSLELSNNDEGVISDKFFYLSNEEVEDIKEKAEFVLRSSDNYGYSISDYISSISE
ncbi:hypothetical protein [Salinibacter ruber]|nr:hypothetical protein [Salinibacter ruber]MCS4187257.1 hypothetical protein [Salinibacter ruber]